MREGCPQVFKDNFTAVTSHTARDVTGRLVMTWKLLDLWFSELSMRQNPLEGLWKEGDPVLSVMSFPQPVALVGFGLPTGGSGDRSKNSELSREARFLSGPCPSLAGVSRTVTHTPRYCSVCSTHMSLISEARTGSNEIRYMEAIFKDTKVTSRSKTGRSTLNPRVARPQKTLSTRSIFPEVLIKKVLGCI